MLQLITLVNQKFTPLSVNSGGDIVFALCLTGLSSGKTSGNVFIQMLDIPKRFAYSFQAKNFIEVGNHELSDREKQILKLMVNERATGKIASLLFISENTVKHHKKNIFEKLGVNSMDEAVFYAKIKQVI